MTAKRARDEDQVSDDGKSSDVVFKKGIDSLTKQANDLSILCGVDIGIVVHKSKEGNAVLWPSPEVVDERMKKFLELPESERRRKMVNHEKYLEGRVDDETRKMIKLRKKKNLMETQLLMNEITKKDKINFDGLDLVQLNNLKSLMDDVLEKLYKRGAELDNDQQH